MNLRDEIQQRRPFQSREQEAFLSIGRTWALLDHALSEMLKPHGVTATQYNALRILRGAKDVGLSRSEITERMVARVPDATRLLDRLERTGLIDRQRDPADRRFVKARITGQGLALLDELDDGTQTLHREHLGCVSQEDLDTLIGLLARIREAV
ncbi:MAG: MarR family transcriptional regulator [Gemmatimonadota bacterium]